MISSIARYLGLTPDPEVEVRAAHIVAALKEKLASIERLAQSRQDHVTSLNRELAKVLRERDAAVVELKAHIMHAEEYTREHTEALELRDREIDLLRSMKQAKPRSLKRIANALAQPRDARGFTRK